MAKDPMKPRAPAPRQPLDNSKVHGNIHNPPRMMEMGGASAMRGIAGAPRKSSMPAIKKPGDGRRA